MSWRTVVIKSRSKLDYKMEYLVVRTEEATSRIHLSEIAVLLIESTAVSLTAYLLAELCRHKIKVIVCDEKCDPCAELVRFYGSHDCPRKVREQMRWGEELKKLVWADIVRTKIAGQLSNLPPEADTARTLLSSYIAEVAPGDPTNREGHAAKVYFNALFGMGFSRGDISPVNAALNYGYGIVLSAFNREIVAHGYLTQLGIFHDNMFNHFNLSCDFMEPFRILVDRKVKGMSLSDFSSNEKHLLVNVLNEIVNINQTKQTVLNAIKLYCRSVFDALNEGDPSLIQFYSL